MAGLQRPRLEKRPEGVVSDAIGREIVEFSAECGLILDESQTYDMLLAMGITAFFCIAVGVYPAPLYALLPYDVAYESYTTTHVVTQLQLLMFSAVAFTVLMRTGIYPPELKSVNLDTDWTYRKAGPAALRYLYAVWQASSAFLIGLIGSWAMGIFRRFQHSTGPEGRLAQSWPTGAMVIWIAILLGVTMMVNFLS